MIREVILTCLFLAYCILDSNAAWAKTLQFGDEVRTFCSRSEQGLYMFSECLSTIVYLDGATSDVYYCNGEHIVVTKGSAVQSVDIRAECVLSFKPFSKNGSYTLLDVTRGQLPTFPASKTNLYPDGIAWVASSESRDIQFCSQFLAGLAGIQSRCVAATFR
jgi:hypothetical protein